MSTNAPTTIPQFSAAQMGKRLAQVYPNGWASPDATLTGIASLLFGMLGGPLAFELTALQYADFATRIQTAVDDALDLAGLDFFGTGLYTLPRYSGESDTLYRARLLAAMFPEGATRQAISDALQKLTEATPRIIEPWSPRDTGVLGGRAGQGAVYWNVDNSRTPFRWTGRLPYQGFIETTLPVVQPFGKNRTPCYDSSFYWGVPSSALMQSVPGPRGASAIYSAINKAKVEGTAVWVRLLSTG